MKVKQEIKPRIFEPVTVTIESLDELKLITSLLGGCNYTIDTTFNVHTDELYQYFLEILKSYPYPEYYHQTLEVKTVV